ncbi:MAG: glycosyltransferase family 4 protein [Anaerolineae bacterium]
MVRIALVRGPFLRPNGAYPWEYLHTHYDGFEVTAFSSIPERFDTSSLQMPVVNLHWPDGKLTVLGYRHFLSRALRGVHLPPNVLWGLGRALRDFDVIHTTENSNFFSLQAALSARGKRFCLAVDENIPYPRWQHSPLMWWVKSYLNRRAYLITVTTDLGRRALIHEGVDDHKIFTLPSGAVDVDSFTPGPKSPESIGLPGGLKETFNLLFVGKIQEAKGIPWLFEAFESLYAEHSDMRLILVGTDALGSQYQDLRRSIKQHPGIILPGPIPYDSMPRVVNLCDLLILPSIPVLNWEEQFGMCLVEAMSCGKPTIASNVGGIPYAVEDGETSILVPYKSSEAIRDAVLRLYLNPELAQEMGQKGRRLALHRYSKAATGERLYEIYRHLDL